MARSIEALRDRLTSGAPLEEGILRELEKHFSKDHGGLKSLCDLCLEVTGTVRDPESIRMLRKRVVMVVDQAIERSGSEAVRGTLRRRKADLLLAMDQPDEAADELVAAFRELPDEEVLSRLSDLADLSASPEIQSGVLRARVSLASDPSRRADAARQLAGRLLGESRVDEAAELFTAVLEVVPDDATATEGLEAIASIRAGQAAHLDTLREKSSDASDKVGMVDALLSLAGSLFLDDPTSSEAVEALERAVATDTANPDAAREYLAALVRAEQWDELESAVDTWVAADGADAVLAHREGGLALLKAGESRLRASLAHLQAARDALPADPDVIDGLDVALSGLGDYEGLRALLQTARKATRTRADERRWLVREAEIVWRELGDMDVAEKMFRRVRASDPRDLTALAFYEEYLRLREDWKRLHAILSQKLALVPVDERVEVARRMASIAEDKMGNLPKAIEAYKRVLMEDPTAEKASEQLVELYRKTGKWHALIEFLNSQIRRLGADADPQQHVALLFQVIDIYQDPERLPVEEMVIHTYNRVVEISPTNVVALDSLAQKYEDARRWSELVQILQKKIKATEKEEDLLDLFQQVADLYLSKMSSEAQAIPFLEKILDLDPTNLDVVRKLRGIYKAKHNLERLYATYEAELHMLEGKRREPVLTELAVLATDKLYWYDKAIRHWEALLELNPRNEKAVSSLSALYAQEGRWADFGALLRGRLGEARTKRKRVEVLSKLGQILFDKLGQMDDAEAVYIEILQINATNMGARRTLQRIYVASRDWAKLEALYAHGKDWKSYVDFLDETAEGEEDTDLRRQIQMQSVHVLEDRVGDTASGVSRLERLMLGDPESTELAAMLNARYAQTGEVKKRLGVLSVLAEFSHNPFDVALAVKTAVEILVKAEDYPRAFDWAVRQCDLAVDDGRVDGLDQLQEIGGLSDRIDDLADYYADAAGRLGGVEERRDVLRRRGMLLKDRLRRNKEAIEVFEELSHLDETDWSALQSLEELTRMEHDIPGLEQALVRQSDLLTKSRKAADKKRLRACRLELGGLYEDILDEPDQAVAVYRALLDESAGDQEGVEGLDRIFTIEERWEDLLALVDEQLERADQQTDLLNRAAGLLHQRMGDPDGAIERLVIALEGAPANPGSVDRLNALLDDGVDPDRVSEMLEPALEALGRWERLADVLTSRLDRTMDADARRQLLATVAAVREQHLNDPAGAFRLRSEQVAMKPEDADARTELERLAEVVDRWEDTAALYAAVLRMEGADAPMGLADSVAALDDTADEPALVRRLAEIYEKHAVDDAKSVACYERVRGFEPESLEILAALERLHARQESWEELLAVYRVRAELVWEDEEKQRVYLDICGLLRSELDRAEESIDWYRKLLELDEGNTGVIAELEDLYTQFERWTDLVDLLRRRLTLVEDKDPRIDILFELAVIFRDRLENIDKSIDTLNAILTEEPDHEETIGALEALLIRSDLPGYEAFAIRVADILQPWFHEKGQWDREVGVLKVRAEQSVDDVSRSAHYTTMGQLHEDKGGDLEEALGFYSRAFELDPASEKTDAALTSVCERLERWEELADVLELSARDDEAALATQLLGRVAGLARERLDDSQRAIDVWRRVLDIDPIHSGALQALDELYAQADEPAQRVAILEQRADASDDETTKRGLMFEVGRIHESLGNTDEAIDGFAYVAEHGDPAHEEIAREALDRLQALYEAGEQWTALVSVLNRKAEAASEDDERKTWLCMAAETLENRLGSVEEAITLFERVREIDPQDDVAFESLARLLDDAQRWDDLEALFLSMRAMVSEDDQANRFDYMLGQLYEGRMDRLEDALNHYEAILDRSADFKPAVMSLTATLDDQEHGLRASEILLRAHTTTDNADGLARVLARRLEAWPDEVDQSATNIRLAQILEHRFDDKEKAFESLCQAALVNWSEPDSLREDLVRLAEATGHWEQLEAVDREVLGRAESGEERIAVLLEMANVARFNRADLDAAEGVLREVLEIDAGHAYALEALRELYEETDRAGEVVQVLRVQVEFAEEATDKIALLYQVGALQVGSLEAWDEAVDTYEQVLAIESQERDAYRQIEEIYTIQEQWDDVVTVLQRELEVLDDGEDKTATRRRMAETLYHKVQDRERALDEATTLLRQDPDGGTGLAILEDALADGHEYERVIRLLIPRYESTESWEQLIGLYAGHVEKADDDSGRIWALEAIRKLQLDTLNDPKEAFDTLQAIVRLAPEDQARWKVLDSMASEQERQDELADFYAELLELSDDAGWAVPLAIRAAELHELGLDDVGTSIARYRFALQREPANERAIGELTRLFESSERWGDLVALYAAAVDEVLDAAEKRRMLLAQARLLDQKLNEPEDAADALARMIEDDPGDREALGTLEEILQRLGRHEELEEHYRSWLDVAEPDETWDIRYRLSLFLAVTRSEPANALAELARTMEENPAHQSTIELLERLVVSVEADEEEAVALQGRAADMLAVVFDDSTDWERWESVYRAQLAATEDHSRQLELRTALGGLFEDRAKEPGDAFEEYGRAFDLDYGSSSLEGKLESLARANGLWAELAGVYTRGLDGAPGDEERAQYLLRLAQIRRDNLDDAAGAAVEFERLLEVDPEHKEALTSLEAWHEAQENSEALARVLRLRLDATNESADRIAILYRVADLELSQDQAETASGAYREILDLDPTQADAKDLLIQLYTASEEWEELIHVYRLKLDHASEDDDRIDLLREIAELHERRLNAADDAVRTWRQVLEVSPQNLYAISNLERLYPEVEDWRGLLEVLEIKRSMFGSPRDRVDVDFQMGAVLFEHLTDSERALEHFRMVLAQQPEHDGTIEYLEQMLDDADVRMAVTIVLEPIYEQRADYPKQASLLGVQLEDTDDDEERVFLLGRLAEIKDQHLDDPDGAITTLGQAFLLAPTDEDIRTQLRDVADRSERWEALAGVYHKALSTITDVDVTREVSGWLAALSEEHLGDLDGAVDRYREVLSYDEFNASALSSLGRLLERQGRWEELVDVLRRELAEASGAAAREKRTRLADVLLDKVRDPEGALEIYKELLWEDSDDQHSLEAMGRIAAEYPFLRDAVVHTLTPIHQSAERWDEVIDLLLLGVQDDATPGDLARVFRQVGDLYEKQMGDREAAFAYYRQAVEAEPDMNLLRHLERLAVETGRYAELNALYGEVIPRTGAAEQRKMLLLASGRLSRDHLEDMATAEARFREVLELDAEDHEALLSLEVVYEKQGRTRELITICEARARLPIELAERVKLYRKIALAAEARQDLDKAEESWNELLDLDSTDSNALRALEALHRGRGDYHRLGETMERRAESTEDPTELIGIRVALGHLRQDQLNDVDAAIDAFEEALELDSVCADALAALDVLYEKAGEWPDLVRILQSRVEDEQDEVARIALLTRLGSTADLYLNDPDTAIGSFEQVLLLDPLQEHAVDELLRIYRKQEMWEELVRTYERKMGMAHEGQVLTALELELAELCADRLSDGDRARTLVDRVVAREPGHPTALRLKARLETVGANPEDAIETWEALLPSLTEPTEQIHAYLSLGRLYLDAWDNTTKAQVCFRDALKIDPDHEDANSMLKEVLYRRESWEAVIPVLEREYKRAGDRKRLAETAHEIAALYRDKMGNTEQAFVWLQAGYKAKRDYKPIVEDLVEHHMARDNADEAAPLLAWLVSYLEAKRMYAELAVQSHRLGALFERTGDARKALQAYKVANQYDSRNAMNLLALGRLYYEAGDQEKALQHLQGMLLLQHDIEDDALKAQMFLFLARVCVSTGDKAKARRHIKRLLALDPNHTEGNALAGKL